jgi:hypothetical protein
MLKSLKMTNDEQISQPALHQFWIRFVCYAQNEQLHLLGSLLS